ncbi:MAG: polyphosphate kinase 1 [Thermoanaerobaculia bacterium]
MTDKRKEISELVSPDLFFNRELSWLAFARRVLALVEDRSLPLLERVKFAGIMGMLHDEFFMKRIGGLKFQLKTGREHRSLDGRTADEELRDCRAEIRSQIAALARVLNEEIRPALAQSDLGILDYRDLTPAQRERVDSHFERSVLPILTPLAVDAEHPFPFISGLGLNLAVRLALRRQERFVRIKVPANRGRWVPVPGSGWVPLEQVIAANLDHVLPHEKVKSVSFFRVTRGMEAEDRMRRSEDDLSQAAPGSIIGLVTDELKARRFAGVVRLEVAPDMPPAHRDWLAGQLGAVAEDIYSPEYFLGLSDLLSFHVDGHPELHDRPHVPVTHPRLKGIGEAEAFFSEVRRGDLLLHHPYQSFDTSVLRFLELAATDPRVLAIKLTIYRTASESPIVRALADAARAGKQVAVLVEITARFDEAPNIAWGRVLEREGAHVAYGVERLKTHVKLALVVREEEDGLRRYVHVGTGNYHTGTARIYEDLGLLSCEPELAADVASVFNELTGSAKVGTYRRMIVAPEVMRDRFVELIRREAAHAGQGRPSGIRAKMNQLQDPIVIRELYRASQAGVPISLNVRGLCCLKPGVTGLSESIRVFSVLGRFLEHGRIYRFENGGAPELFIGSADWMRRNLDHRVETIAPVADPALKADLTAILDVYENDNDTAWDLQPDGSWIRRQPRDGEPLRSSQEVFMALAAGRTIAEKEVAENGLTLTGIP